MPIKLTQPRPMLMSGETEYSVSGLRDGQRQEPATLFLGLRDSLRTECQWLADGRGAQGMFLGNGARFYLDFGAHPEYAQPEANGPLEVAAHDLASERLLRRAAQAAESRARGLTLTLVKNNIGPYFPHKVTFGAHESYTCWAPLETAARALIPHLATRIVYAGAGCLSAQSGGIGFQLSQRAQHIECPTGHDTTANRPLFCLRSRKAIDVSEAGFVRAHLICRDSLRLPFGTYLTYGTTGLLFHHLNQGRSVGEGLQLRDPVRALKQISADPALRIAADLSGARSLTAVEIQRHYLDQCIHWQRCGDAPEWSDDLLQHWAQTLDALQTDPLRLADRLDVWFKWAVFSREIERAGLRWPAVQEGFQRLIAAREKYSEEIMRAVFAGSSAELAAELHPRYGEAVGFLGDQVERARFAARLQWLDRRFHTLGDWCDELRDAGHLSNVVLTNEQIESAMTNPPPGNRAATRGQLIREHSGDPNWLCDWQFVFHPPSDTGFDLSDPFSLTPQTWRSLPEGDDIVVSDFLLAMRRRMREPVRS